MSVEPSLAPGVRLGTYEIAGVLGAGGMGEVYRASDTRLGREVALKLLPTAFAADPERLARFEREARMLAALNHPNIAHLYAFEQALLGDGTRVHLLAMELVEGEDLAARLRRGPVPVDEAVAIARQVAEALREAHEKGIVHRDLKPANVKVLPDGRVKVLDFGLARMGGSTAPEDTGSQLPTDLRTTEGAVMGTLPYMSPEQVAGRPVDARSDVFSLGVLIYEMASGRRPFRGDSSAELASSILRDAPPPLAALRAGLPRELISVVIRCLEKDPAARFQGMGDVHAALASPAVDGRASRARRSGWHSRTLAICGVGLALLAASAFVATRSGLIRPGARGQAALPATAAIRSIAVLPLDNYSGDAAQDYFAEGMTDELTTQLATISRLRVISRGSAMQFKGAQRPPTPQIAKTLDVDAIVEGSVLRSGERVRITAQLIDARADRHLWARSFERSSRDVLALQDELASAIAREIHVQLSPAEQSRLARARSVNPEGYDAYLKGRYFFNRPSDENLQKAIARFEETIALEPAFAPAHSGLSDVYLWAGYNEGFLTASEARPKAKAAAERAIELDGDSAEAHTSLANFALWYEYDFPRSEAEYRRALALNPSYAYAHDQFGMGLAFQGRLEEAIAEGRRAAELDPLSPQIPLDAVIAFAWKGDYATAGQLVNKASDLDATFFMAPWVAGWMQIQAGRPEQAVALLQKAEAMESAPFASAWLAYARGAAGDRKGAAAGLETLKRRSLRGSPTAFDLAIVHLGQGDHARALSELERAHATDSQWLGWLGLDRTFDPLRAEPRFVALLRKLGLETARARSARGAGGR